jgi:hypothetical protein
MAVEPPSHGANNPALDAPKFSTFALTIDRPTKYYSVEKVLGLLSKCWDLIQPGMLASSSSINRINRLRIPSGLLDIS